MNTQKVLESVRKNLADIAKDIEENGTTITESSLSRLHEKMQERSVGIISAFRDYHTLNENKKRSRDLYSDLMREDRTLSVTKVKGGYVENYGTPDAAPVQEESYFVASSIEGDDKGYLDRILQKLGRKYDQDSVALSPFGDDKWVLLGTNRAKFPGFGKRLPIGKFRGGQIGEFFTKVRNRPFVFESGEVMMPPASANGLRALRAELDSIDEEYGTDWD